MNRAALDTRGRVSELPVSEIPVSEIMEADEVVLLCGTAAWDGWRLGSHFLAEALARHVPVVYVDPPRSVHRAWHSSPAPPGRPRLDGLGPNLARLTPLAPPGQDRAGVRVATRWAFRRTLRQFAHSFPGRVRAVISGQARYDPFGVCGERVRIFRVSDDYEAAASLNGVPAGRIRRAQERLARGADVVVCVSPPLVDAWKGRGYRAVLVPNGCDAAALASARALPDPPDVRLRRPIVGYVGQLSSRIDLGLLEAVAGQGHSVLLVGRLRHDLRVGRLDTLLGFEHVQWVDQRPAGEVASYLGVMDVGVVPYAPTGFNRASFPLKILEYLAAGLPVVSTPLPAVEWLGTDLVETALEPNAFVEAVERAVGSGSTPALVARRQEFARAHSWDRRAEAYLELL
jgi:glycosyltransferase involved in cell wall biosynthesis